MALHSYLIIEPSNQDTKVSYYRFDSMIRRKTYRWRCVYFSKRLTEPHRDNLISISVCYIVLFPLLTRNIFRRKWKENQDSVILAVVRRDSKEKYRISSRITLHLAAICVYINNFLSDFAWLSRGCLLEVRTPLKFFTKLGENSGIVKFEIRISLEAQYCLLRTHTVRVEGETKSSFTARLGARESCKAALSTSLQ